MINILQLDNDLISLIYDYIPTILKKYCHQKSFQQYLKLYLPRSSLDWNMEYIENSLMKDTIQQFISLESYPMIIHNIYTEIAQQELKSFFYEVKNSQSQDDLYNNNFFVEQSSLIYDIICEHCPPKVTPKYIPLGHHLIIMDCLTDVFNGSNYSRWLTQPEKKLLI